MEAVKRKSRLDQKLVEEIGGNIHQPNFGTLVLRTMCKVYGLRLALNLVIWPMTDEEVYMRLTIDKMSVLTVSKFLRPYSFSGTNFTTTVSYKNPKTEMQIFEMQV